MTYDEIARIEHAQSAHPDWTRAECIRFVTDQFDEYEADRTAVPSE